MEMKLMGLIVFGMVVMVLSPSNGQVTCQQALMELMPCQSFLVGGGQSTPPLPCCSGVKTLVSQASSTQIRRSLCECLKKAAAGLSIDPTRLAVIPQYCQVSIPVPLDPKIDCSTVPLV